MLFRSPATTEIYTTHNTLSLHDALPTYLADVRARCDTPRALPGSRISDRPSRAPWMGDGGSANPRSLSSLAALSAASAGGIGGVGSEERESGDEVTRRVRRPSSVPPVAHTQAPALSVSVSPWRGVLAAGALVVLFLVALWLFGYSHEIGRAHV